MRAGTKAIVVALAAVALFGCANTPVWSGVDPEAASRQINQRMSEAEVVTRIGAPPNTISVETCGSKTGSPWPCKIYKYARGSHALLIYFSDTGTGDWIVDSWRAY